jgi:mono/diheme cytochrome c family protein
MMRAGSVLQGSVAGRGAAAALLGCALAAGCAVQVQNTEPARELARAAAPEGSAYAGWRVFQEKCVACHGPAATGTALGPDLLPRVAEMGPRRFVNLVLKRYDWSFQSAEAAREDTAREALAEQVLQRRLGALAMPAWQDEPSVNAHVMDLYAYLSARAAGTLGPGQPGR